VVEALKKSGAPNYIEDVLEGPSVPLAGISGEPQAEGGGGDGGEQDALYDEAVKIVTTERKPSISYVQRRLKIGYNRAARLLESMENAGVVGPLQPNGSREFSRRLLPGVNEQAMSNRTIRVFGLAMLAFSGALPGTDAARQLPSII
jgi:DNA segregation ATPase FtsK/SpoIIIE-like protein